MSPMWPRLRGLPFLGLSVKGLRDRFNVGQLIRNVIRIHSFLLATQWVGSNSPEPSKVVFATAELIGTMRMYSSRWVSSAGMGLRGRSSI
jgi:hypothetical protein